MPGFEPAWSNALQVKGSLGETVHTMFKIITKSCISFTWTGPPGLSATFFQAMPIVTTQSSYTGAPLGTYYDALIPMTRLCPTQTMNYEKLFVWADFSISKTATPGAYTAQVMTDAGYSIPVAIKIWKMQMPDRPTLPIYVSSSPFALLKGHGLDPNSNVQVEAALGQKYLNLLRSHRIEPYASYIAFPGVLPEGVLNLDLWQNFGGSFRQMVLTGSIARPMFPTREQIFKEPSPDPTPPIVPPLFPSKKSRDYLVAVENTITANNLDAWTYAWDEPAIGEMANLQSNLQAIKTYAPSLDTMVTTLPTVPFISLIDIITGVVDWYDGVIGRPTPDQYPPGFWLYTSCMAHGCGTVSDSGSPDLVIDRPSLSARIFAWIGFKEGAGAILYYNSTESYGKLDPWVSQWLFSGNGDGTLVYPGRSGERGFTDHTALASIRLKLLRESSFDVEYLSRMQAVNPTWLSTQLGILIENPRRWNKDPGLYQKLRDSIGDILNSL